MAGATDETRSVGLSQSEASARLAAEGPNELPSKERRSFARIIWDVLQEPMLLFLLAAGAIYMVLGDLHDAIILSFFAGLTIAIAVVQESRTEKAIDSLRSLAMPQALVIRDGQRLRIPSREVVRGDLLIVGEGERIVADGWAVEADGLRTDEAVLTGESVPVSKRARTFNDEPDLPLPGGDDLPYVFSGTMAVRGGGLVEVVSTGAASHIGWIGQSLATLETETPRLAVQTRKLVRWFAVFGIGVSILAGLLYGLLRGGWLEAALSGIAIAMSMLPEELPVVLTLFMTMGALRMSRSRVLARRGTAIETLGAATVLCTDKTGTLTENRMEVAELRLPDGKMFSPKAPDAGIDVAFAELADLGILACLEQPFDPMEQAFHEMADIFPQAGLGNHRNGRWRMRKHYPLSSDLLAMTNVWDRDDGQEMLVAAKGAPEAIAEICRLDEVARAAMEADVARMASRGLRVLGIAESRWREARLPDDQCPFAFSYRGLVGLADPIRETVPEAVAQLQAAGIRVVMITGDYPATARAIAEQAGITAEKVASGDEIARMDERQLAEAVRGISVFARIMPEQKLRLVRALKSSGEVVAMTGDGVNDAPSLKAANIGIAMGQRGTDVAREASSIVLLDDDFKSIAAAVRLGRRIYDNLRKASGFIFAVHLPIAGLALAPLFFGWPLILGPVHIAMFEMVVDPICTLAFEAEPEEPDVMRRPPRHPESPLVSRGLIQWSAVQGILALCLLLGLAVWSSLSGVDGAQFRTTCFAGLIAAVVTLVFVNRSFSAADQGAIRGGNWPLLVILGLVVAIFAPAFLVPDVAAMLRFSVLDRTGLQAVLALAVTLAVLLWIAKMRFRKSLTS